MHSITSVRILSITAMAWTLVYVVSMNVNAQAQPQAYINTDQGFAQPPANHTPPQAIQTRAADPGILRAPVRTAGVHLQESSSVSQASWSAPVASASNPSPTLRSPGVQSEPSIVPFAPSKADAGKGSIAKPTSSWSSMISMMASLLLVLTLFMGVAWFFRRIAPQPSRSLSKDVVQVLGRTPLAARHNMILIRFGRKLILVSQQLGQTQTLSEIDDPREVDHLLGLCEEANSTSITSSFRDTLYQLASGKTVERTSNTKNFSIAREG